MAMANPQEEKIRDSESESDAASALSKRHPVNIRASLTHTRSSPQEEKNSDSESDASLKFETKTPPKRRPGRRASLTKSFTNRRASFTKSLSGLGFSPGAVLSDQPAAADKKAFGVHFFTREAKVHLIKFDWNHADDVFYTVSELQRMSESRFDNAAALRKQRREECRRRGSETLKDLELLTEATDVSALLTKALRDDDRDEPASIQGIEHFVYPDLQQAMIRKKKEVREEILDFVKSKKPDPQGWRLARRSQELTCLAQDVAQEKGMVYRMKRIHAEHGEGCCEEEEEEEENALDLRDIDVDLPTDEEWRRIEQMLSMPRRNLRGSSLF